MTLTHDDATLLATLLDLARRNVPATAIRLADRLAVAPDEVRESLARLDRQGVVDASRCRLTFMGLVVAAQAQPAAGARSRRAAA